MWKAYRKIHNMDYTLEPFAIKCRTYSRDNIEAMWNRLNEQDQQLFKFSMKNFNWMKYFVDHYKGIRFFLLHEDDSTLDISRARQKK